MTDVVHVANTQVEFEFARSFPQPLDQSLSQHPLCLQLQFLPLLYAQPGDCLAVTALPPSDYFAVFQRMGWRPEELPRLVPLQEMESFYGKRCLSWGPSREVREWAKERRMAYEMPHDWEVIRLVNSKAFSFRYTSLAEAALLSNEKELREWIQKIQGPKVLKTCFGLSGMGNRLVRDAFLSPKILAFCRKEWQQGLPLIGEPWLERVCDFSTQWRIHPDRRIEWIGTTRFETDAQGSYRATLAGPEGELFGPWERFLEPHLQCARKALNDTAKMGFFGPIGIDALLYRDSKTEAICLYPLVEINGRETMSLAALRLQQQLCPHHVLRLAFHSGNSPLPSLLPDRLITSQGKEISFHRRLTAAIVPYRNREYSTNLVVHNVEFM